MSTSSRSSVASAGMSRSAVAYQRAAAAGERAFAASAVSSRTLMASGSPDAALLNVVRAGRRRRTLCAE